jgi:hypothetical protein
MNESQASENIQRSVVTNGPASRTREPVYFLRLDRGNLTLQQRVNPFGGLFLYRYHMSPGLSLNLRLRTNGSRGAAT